MTREEAIAELKFFKGHTFINTEEAIDMAIKALEQEPKTEKIIKMRDATLEEQKAIDKYIKSVSKPIGVDFWDLEQKSKLEQFAKWVAREIFDDYWEYNYEAFAEIACRKLSKLGIVARMSDEWVLVEEPQESEGKMIDCNGNDVTQESKDFFDNLEEGLIESKKQFENCDRCKQNLSKKIDKIRDEIREFSVVDESGTYRISTYLVDQIIDKYMGD